MSTHLGNNTDLNVDSPAVAVSQLVCYLAAPLQTLAAAVSAAHEASFRNISVNSAVLPGAAWLVIIPTVEVDTAFVLL